MKKVFLIFVSICISFQLFAQKDFEGIIVYRNSVSSNVNGLTNDTWKKILALSDVDIVTVRKGNFRRCSAKKDVYYIPEKGRVFYRFKGIDTLYYQDYSDDTSTVLSVIKTDDMKKIAGYDCNSITIQTSLATSKYYYPPSVYMNPEFNRNNKLDQYNVFAKETSSLFLESEQVTKVFTLKQTCLRVQEMPVDKNVFELPNIPQKKLDLLSFITLPEFAGKEGWSKYLQSNINPEVSVKYVKIPRKEDMASQEVLVSFSVSETGNVSNITVLNKKEVHPKLAEEATRVVASSHWRPATVFGEKIAYRMTQPITFQVTKQ